MESTYVVQVEETVMVPSETTDTTVPREAWFDVAEVTVPARTKRKAVIRAGLEKAGLDVTEEIKVRALSAESARVTPVAPFTPPSQLKIG